MQLDLTKLHVSPSELLRPMQAHCNAVSVLLRVGWHECRIGVFGPSLRLANEVLVEIV